MARRVARINSFLYDRTKGSKYATVFYCLIERGGRLHYVNGGHCAPILISQDGRYEYLETTAMPVGMLPEAEFTVEERQLFPGDRIVIYTDGVTEAQNQRGEFFSRKQLREIVVAHAGDACTALHDAVLRTLKNFTGGAAQADDITLVVVEYHPD
jgi:sigma-B regulation protein RsbU (phosphoserine phosphatase)